MLPGALFLLLLHGPDGRVLRAADRTLNRIVLLVDTPLMERVFAQEVDCRKIEELAIGCATPGLEDDRFGAQFLYFFAFAFGFRSEGLDDTPVL